MSVLLLADSFGRATAWATRIGVGIFLVFFSAYDTLAGIGTWLAMRSARDLSPAQQELAHSKSPTALWSASSPSRSSEAVALRTRTLALTAEREDPQLRGMSSAPYAARITIRGLKQRER